MLNLIFAPSADHLVPLAAKRMRDAWTDPFDPPAIVVPNPDVGKWLRARLIETPGLECVANARVLRLERFLWDALGGGDASMLTAGHMAQIVCALLNDELLRTDIYEPLRNYLYNDDGNIDALKRVQLSMRIAGQFLEYEYNRPSVWNDNTGWWKLDGEGIDAKWLNGKKYFDGDVHELWQMDLYRRVYERVPQNELTTLPHLYRRRREERAKEKTWCDVGSNKQIFLFGVSKISHFHRNTLVEISQTGGVDMHVFLTNPCAEFWEDVDTSRRSFKPRRKWSHNSPSDQAGIKPVKPEDYNKEELDLFNDEEDHELLKLWGSAGKENIYLWCPQAEWNFEYHCENDNAELTSTATSKPTLLKAIQLSLLSRENDLDISGIDTENDLSLQILACPDIGREVEELREQILDMAHDGAIKTFNDVAVYIPDPNKYLPHIQRVFGAYPTSHPEFIPFNIQNAAGGASVTAQGLTALLNIIGGQFNRAQIFDLFRNPVARASKNITAQDLDRWAQWTEEYGMFRGYNAEQRKKMGDMGDAATDEHTFMRGIRKICGDELCSPATDTATKINDPNDTALSGIVNDNETSSEQTSAKKFRALLDELNVLSSALTSPASEIDVRESIEIVRRAVWSWFGRIPADGSVNGRGESDVRAGLLDGLDRILLQQTLAGRALLPLDEFIAHLRGCVQTDSDVSTGASGGVTFAPLRVSTALPHRAVFVLGLGASDFPGTNEKGNWDLLSGVSVDRATGKPRRNRIVGDSDKVRDNRFAFLELIHAAKERLVLSYRAHDMQKDEPFEPSSVILELEGWLKDRGGTICPRREIPWIIHESIEVAVGRGRKHGTWDRETRELIADDRKTRVRHRHDIITTINSQNKKNTYNVSAVPIRDIKLFLKNPLEYHLAKVLKIRDDDEGDMAVADEPVASMFNLSRERKEIWFAILDMVFSSTERLSERAEEAARRVYGEHVESGHAPEGHAKRMEEEELVRWTARCAFDAVALRKIFPAHRFSRNGAIDKDSEGVISIDCGEFTITGDLAPAIIPVDPQDKTQCVGIISFVKNGAPKSVSGGKDGDNYELWLDAATRRLCDIKAGREHAIKAVLLDYHQNAKTRITRKTIDLGDADNVKAYLATLAAQMLADKRFEHLPFEAIAKLVDISGEKNGDGQAANNDMPELTVDALRESLAKYGSYTDGFDLTDANSGTITFSDAELRETVGVRYAPIFERWIYDDNE